MSDVYQSFDMVGNLAETDGKLLLPCLCAPCCCGPWALGPARKITGRRSCCSDGLVILFSSCVPPESWLSFSTQRTGRPRDLLKGPALYGIVHTGMREKIMSRLGSLQLAPQQGTWNRTGRALSLSTPCPQCSPSYFGGPLHKA